MSRLSVLLLGLIAAYAQAQSDLRVETFLLPGSSVNASRIAVRFTNMSSHPLVLPTDNFIYPDGVMPGGPPAKGLYFADTIFSCLALPGLVAFDYLFAAENPELTTACHDSDIARVAKPPLDVVQRAKAWMMLEPHASTTREIPLASVLPIQAGTFRNVRAVYRSPKFSPEDKRKLDDANIQLPSGEYVSSDSFSFETDGQSLVLLDGNPPKRKPHSRPLMPAAAL